jgi:hypothetical protein
MKLYDIPFEAAQIEQQLMDADGELTPEIEKQIGEFLNAGKDKIEAAAMVVRTLEMEAEACKAEAKRLQERSASFTKNADRLKGLVLVALDSAFGGKVKTPLFTIWGQTSAPTIAVELTPDCEVEKFAAEFPWAVKQTIELKKREVVDSIKAGNEIPPGVMYSENPGTRYLRIK